MVNKQKILFVITKGNWGGAQKYVFELASRLPRDTYEVVVAHGIGEELPYRLTELGIRTIFIPALGRDVHIGKDIASFFSLISLFRKERPTVVHLNSSKIGGLGALAARIAHIPKIVFTVHGFAFNEDRPWIQKKIISILSWITIVLCTDVIFITKNEFTNASQWIGIRSKLHLIYNGIPVPSFLEKKQAHKTLAEHMGISEDTFKNKVVIGTIGELTKNKGYTYAIQALKDIPTSVYLIIGDGELKQTLQTQITESNATQKILLAGFLPEASRYLQAFDIFLLPSLKEGMPYVLLEAGFARLPVITTPVGGIPEIITDTIHGFFITPHSSDSIKEVVEKVIADKKMHIAAAHHLHQKVIHSFSVDNLLTQTRKVYKL